MRSVGYSLGVDLGTTYTAAAISRSAGVEAVQLGADSAAIPSVLFFAEDDTVLVGDAAARRGAEDPTRVVRRFKRHLGDPAPMQIGHSSLPAHVVGGHLLRWVVDLVTAREGGPPDTITVTFPANWGPYKREFMDQLVASARVDAELLEEPVAAAIGYAAADRMEDGDTVAVYDLGGGTFDAAVLRAEPEGFAFVGRASGMEQLGGVDFDDALFRFVCEAASVDLDHLDRGDPMVVADVQRLRDECVAAKLALSSDVRTSVHVALAGGRTTVAVTRADFEQLIRPLVAESVSTLEHAIVTSGVDVADIDRVLLVGGSSRIPLVGALVSEQLQRPVTVDADPKLVTAKGAALAAAMRSSATSDPAPTEPEDPGPPPRPPSGSGDPAPRRQGRRGILGAAVIALALIAGVILILTRGGGDTDEPVSSGLTESTEGPAPETPTPPSPVATDQASATDEATASPTDAPSTQPNDDSAFTFTLAATRQIDGILAERPVLINDELWVPAKQPARLDVLDPTTLEPIATIQGENDYRAPVVAGGLAWSHAVFDFVGIDPTTHAAVVKLEGVPLSGLDNAVDGDLIYVGRSDVTVVDAVSRSVVREFLPDVSQPQEMLLFGDHLFMFGGDEELVAVDVSDGSITRLAIAGTTFDIAVVVDHIWVATSERVEIVDPVAMEIVKSLDRRVFEILEAGGLAWLSQGDGVEVFDPDTLIPQAQFDPAGAVHQGDTNGRIVAYRVSGALAGDEGPGVLVLDVDSLSELAYLPTEDNLKRPLVTEDRIYTLDADGLLSVFTMDS